MKKNFCHKVEYSGSKRLEVFGNQNILDNQWAEKQAVSFTDWMNFVFAKGQNASSLADRDDSNDLQNEALAICEVTRKCEEEQQRKGAILLFRSGEVASAIAAVGEEVSQGKLNVREDRDVLHDLGLHEALFGILFSYDLHWLCLALEVVFQCALPKMHKSMHRNQQRTKNMVKTYVQDHLLSSASISAQFPKQSALFQSQEKRLRGLLRDHLVVKFLSLVLLLDSGRCANLLPVTTLFVRESIYKSSKDVLTSFCRCFMRGEGDLVRHLALIGYKVRFTQVFVDEFDYPVANLAVDLRDGVRLARLMDLLTKSVRFTKQLRVPAGSRLQMWRIMSCFELQHLIDTAAVRSEIDTIRTCGTWRRSVYSDHAAARMAVRVRTSKCNDTVQFLGERQDSSGGLGGELMAWCQSVAEQFEVPVYNLTSCLADGRALCLLVHYYHPTILPTSAIKKTTANLADDPSASDVQKALNGERRNYQLLHKACKEIGGVPLMVAEFDSRQVPEEKSMVALLAYLFMRLTESSEQVRAAIRLQRLFRSKHPMSASVAEAVPTEEAFAVKECCVVADAAPSLSDDRVDDEGAVEAQRDVDNKVSADPPTHHALEAQLAEEKRLRIKAELQSQFDNEKQLLLSLELKVAAASDALRMKSLQAERTTKDAEQYAEAEAHRYALLAADRLSKSEYDARIEVESLLRNSRDAVDRERLWRNS